MPLQRLRRNIMKFHGEHGIYFLYTREIMDIVAEQFNVKVKDLNVMLFAHYVSKYITRTNAINPTLVALAARESKLDYRLNVIKRVLATFYAKQVIGKYGDTYVSNHDTAEFLKMFSNQLTYKLHNFNLISFEKECNTRRRPPRAVTAAEQRRRSKAAKAAARKRRIAKRDTLAKLRREEKLKKQYNETQNQINEGQV